MEGELYADDACKNRKSPGLWWQENTFYQSEKSYQFFVHMEGICHLVQKLLFCLCFQLLSAFPFQLSILPFV